MGIEALLSTQVLDTTSVGRSVMTAADAAAARVTLEVDTSLTGLDEWNAAASELVIPGYVIIRQPGGTAGTDEVQISHDGENAIIEPMSGRLQVDGNLTARNGTFTTLLVTSGTSQINQIQIAASNGYIFASRCRIKSPADGLVELKNHADTEHAAIQVSHVGYAERSTDPADPPEGQSVQWQSDGTGSGDDGDIMMKITAGGVTKTTTLVDFSAI
jgi:hypothetical protein